MLLKLTKPFVGSEEAEAVKRVLNSGWLAEGIETRNFETEIARFTGARFAVATNNCTIALTLCLIAEGVKGKVAIPDFTHPATAHAVLNAGCKPVLYDVSLDSYNLQNQPVEKTVIPVSWAGNPLTYTPLGLIIEDAACSLGADDTGASHTCCFSFHPRKLITTGEGAVITTNSATVAAKLRDLKNFGCGRGNYRFNDISAAIGLEQLKKLPRIIKIRREMAMVYDRLLFKTDGVKTPFMYPDHTYQTYAVLLTKGNRDQVITNLAKKGIETQIGTYALHLLPQFRRYKRVGTLENSALLAKNLLALPMAYDLSFDDQEFIVEALKNELI